MPAETRLYVPKLQAMKNLVANPQDKGIQLPTIPNHPYFQSVPLPRDMDVDLVARLAEVPIEDFKALNPSAHRPVLLAGGTSQILLPWDNAEIFERNMATYEGRLASWTVWVAPKNMKVPEAAKRVGMSKEDMSSVNKIPPRMLIKAGSALLVPRPSKQEQDVTSKVADNGQLNLAPEVFLRKQVIKVGKKDTLANFAKRYRIAATDVAKWNRLSLHSTLKPGQKLVLMLPVKPRGKK
jgi:membrane-bound lytic murein transglycosylase D